MSRPAAPHTCLFLLLVSGCSLIVEPSEVSQRDPLRQPYSRRSVWNLPLGRNAILAPAKLASPQLPVFFAPMPTIMLWDPSAPRTAIYENTDFDNGRCYDDVKKGPPAPTPLITDGVPIPADFVVVGKPDGGFAPANPTIIAQSDGLTFHQLEFFARCKPQEAATALRHYVDTNALEENGIAGGHLGSGLSILGGVLRLGELSPGAPRIRHVLKLAIANTRLFGGAKGSSYIWPGTIDHSDHKTRYSGSDPKLRPGALLALPESFDTSRLESPAGRQIAWTLKHFGAYVVKGNGSDHVHVSVEVGPRESVESQYRAQWGVNWRDDEGWKADSARIMTALQIVENWNQAAYKIVADSDGSLGVGGGPPRTHWNPPLRK
jgi:hypothetical protein